MAREAASKDLIEPEGVDAGPTVSPVGADQTVTEQPAGASGPVSEPPTGGDNGELLSRPGETRTTRPAQRGQEMEAGEA